MKMNQSKPATNERGSALLAALVMVVVIGGMCAVIQVATLSTHRAANLSSDLNRAAHTARSALGYYAHRLELDHDYFVNHPEHASIPLGDTSFRLESAVPGGSLNEWIVVITAVANQVEYRIHGVIDADELEFPQGLVLGGTGDPDDVILEMNGGTRFGSYDPAVGTGTLNENASVWANGSIDLKGSATINGDVFASGTISAVGSAGVSGDEAEGAVDFPIDPFEEYAAEIATGSIASNNNGALPAVFGARWNPVAGPGSPGNLNLNGGNFVLGAGTYLMRNVTISGGAQLLLDTTGGPITLVVTGPAGMTLSSGSQVRIQAGATTNGVTTVLGAGCGFTVQGGSLYGQEVAHLDAAGYSNILSAGPGGLIQAQGGSRVQARLAAPSRDFFVGGDSTWLGSAMARTARFIGSGPKFLVDESILGRIILPSDEYVVETSWRGDIEP